MPKVVPDKLLCRGESDSIALHSKSGLRSSFINEKCLGCDFFKLLFYPSWMTGIIIIQNDDSESVKLFKSMYSHNFQILKGSTKL